MVLIKKEALFDEILSNIASFLAILISFEEIVFFGSFC
ncbi:hypothetical protein NT07LI_0253 [Listeria innocua FSL S4-378]|nr:hypothetical protein NT07LI_0253 [Listeria innocua FSL S4-378]